MLLFIHAGQNKRATILSPQQALWMLVGGRFVFPKLIIVTSAAAADSVTSAGAADFITLSSAPDAITVSGGLA